jgi:DNA-binding response OmpR family regulator
MRRTAQRVLIVEDDEMLQDFLQDVLSEDGYRAIGCATMEAAQQLVQIAPPDLVILDLHLEGTGSGLDVLAWLRRQGATATTPVIICSADVPLLRALAETFDAHHCFAVIEKPLNPDDLLMTVYAAIGPAQVWYSVSAA